MTRPRQSNQYTSEVDCSRSSSRVLTAARAHTRLLDRAKRLALKTTRNLLFLVIISILLVGASSSVRADDCRRVPYILVLFDASGFMKDKDRYHFLLQQMNFFKEAMPLTADGLFDVGLRHYGLKVGMGCNNTESILPIQPWDPERFINSFPQSVSYGVSSLGAGLRAAGDEISQFEGKSIIVLIGGGIESCNVDTAKLADRLAFNNPDLEIHTFQIGDASEGRFHLKAIAQKCRGTYTQVEEMGSAAGWHAWMKRHMVKPCAPAAPAPGAASTIRVGPVVFDFNSFSVRSKDAVTDAQNQASMNAVISFLQAKPTRRVVLHAYTDGKGKPEYNIQLSKRRAEAVADHLTNARGVNQAQITIVAHGAAQDAPRGQESPAGRRVEFELVE